MGGRCPLAEMRRLGLAGVDSCVLTGPSLPVLSSQECCSRRRHLTLRPRPDRGWGLLGAWILFAAPWVLVGCRGHPHVLHKDLLTMVDCQFDRAGAVHLHVSEARGTASVVSDYEPAPGGEHAEALRQGRESKGTLAPAGDSRYRIEVFLRNDKFGSPSEESLRLILDPDGEARFEAQAPSGPLRVLDRGSCLDAH